MKLLLDHERDLAGTAKAIGHMHTGAGTCLDACRVIVWKRFHQAACRRRTNQQAAMFIKECNGSAVRQNHQRAPSLPCRRAIHPSQKASLSIRPFNNLVILSRQALNLQQTSKATIKSITNAPVLLLSTMATVLQSNRALAMDNGAGVVASCRCSSTLLRSEGSQCCCA